MMAPPPAATRGRSTATPASGGPAADRSLEDAVRRALREDVLVPDEAIEVTAVGRRIRLGGLVRTAADRREAGIAARRVPGVEEVDNRLQVGGPPLEVERIRREIEDLLVRHARREAAALEIRLDGDVVRITGTLPSWGRRSAVERFVASMPRVRRVDDGTVVDPLL
jgi:osmotically-inducible protein OsmY